MVQILSGTKQWTGFVVQMAVDDPLSTYILTASDKLGVEPLVSVRFSTGKEVEGWVWGRDDDHGFALIKLPRVDVPAVELGGFGSSG